VCSRWGGPLLIGDAPLVCRSIVTRASATAQRPQPPGISPAYIEYAGKPEQALDYVVSLNVNRRHLTDDQRKMVAARISNLKRGQHTTEDNPAIGGISPTTSELWQADQNRKLVSIPDAGKPEMALDYVVSLNLNRRHLTDDQRKMCAARIANLKRGGPATQDNPSSGRIICDEGNGQDTTQSTTTTTELWQAEESRKQLVSITDAAKKMNVDDIRGVERARTILLHGAEELAKVVDDGDVSVRAAADIAAKLKEDLEKQREKDRA
jgi:hypothetical protein